MTTNELIQELEHNGFSRMNRLGTWFSKGETVVLVGANEIVVTKQDEMRRFKVRTELFLASQYLKKE